MRRSWQRLAIVFLATVPGACLDSIEPDVGPLQKAPCSNKDSDPDLDVSFRDEIVPLIMMSEPIGCWECHVPTAPTPIGFVLGGLDLSSVDTAKRGGINSDGIAIIPGQPCESIVIQKVSSGPPFGARMPIGAPPYLSADLQQLLHDWIAEGAQNN